MSKDLEVENNLHSEKLEYILQELKNLFYMS